MSKKARYVPVKAQPTERTTDSLIQIGIMLGAEWSCSDIARHLGVTPQAIIQKRGRYRANGLIEQCKVWTKVAISKYVEERLKKAEDDMNERKQRLHKKGYRVLEKAVDHALSDEVIEPDQIHLKAAEIGIERVEGKALDRKAILERNEHVYRIEVDGDELEQVLHDVAEINEMRRKLLPPATDTVSNNSVQEAEVVSS